MTRFCAVALGFLIFSVAAPLFGAEATNDNVVATNALPTVTAPVAAPDPAIADLNDLVTRVNEKLQADKTNLTDLADNLKEFDALLVKHKDARVNARVQILLMKAQLLNQYLHQPELALEVFKQIKRDFPNVEIDGGLDNMISDLTRLVANLKIRSTLVPGKPFPPFNETDIAGKPFALADYKGKVVLVDFWATWCMPCLMELPNVQKVYQQYHNQGFDIVGVSLDTEPSKLDSFLKQKKIPWQQYNDGKFWDTKLVTTYGISALPSTFLIDRNGKIIAANLRGDELEQAVAFATMPWLQRRFVAFGRAVDGSVRGTPYVWLSILFIIGLLLGAISRSKKVKITAVKLEAEKP